jgi:hypothetical protein
MGERQPRPLPGRHTRLPVPPKFRYVCFSVSTIRTYSVCSKLTGRSLAGLANATGFVWTIDFSGAGGNPNFNLSQGERFFFGVFETGSSVDGFESQYINITDAGTAPSSPTTSGSAPVSTIPPTSTSSALSTSSTSASPSPTAAAGGLSSGDKAGIGVGVSLGVILAALGIGFFFYRRGKVADGHRYAPPPAEVEAPTTQIKPAELPEEMPRPDRGAWNPATPLYEL